MTDEKKVSEKTLKVFYNALTDVVYEYLNAHHFNDLVIPNQIIVDILRSSTMEYMKRILDRVIQMDDKITPKEINKCQTCDGNKKYYVNVSVFNEPLLFECKDCK